MIARVGLLALLLLCVALPALADEQRRFAIVIGNNQGADDEDPLAYAERDAVRVAEVLVRLGGVAEEDLLLLRGTTAEGAERVLAEVARRIAAERAARPHQRNLMFVYYSGHASVGALHLGRSRLAHDRLQRLVQGAGAHVSVLVLDACRSGGLTRVKGAVPSAPFEIKAEDRLESSGTAIVTSSALGEDAQESDRLQGGIFTHHFVSGLRGAADSSQDGRVTLAEAYRYAFDQTLRTTSRTRFVQHPTYAFRLEGRQDLVLTQLSATAGMGRLHLPQGGSFLVIDRERDGGMVAELEARPGTDVVLRRGRYLVRRRTDRAVDEAEVTVPEGGRVALQVTDMRRVPYGQTVRRGLRERSAWRLGADAGLAGSALPGLSTGLHGGLQAGVDLADVTVLFGVRYGNGRATNSDLMLTHHALGLETTALRMVDLPGVPLAVGPGVRLGVDWVAQRFQTTGIAPDRDQFAGRAAPLVRLEWAPTAGSLVALDLGVDVHAYRVRKAGTTRWDTHAAPTLALGWSMYLP